jgi:hypothetical protein
MRGQDRQPHDDAAGDVAEPVVGHHVVREEGDEAEDEENDQDGPERRRGRHGGVCLVCAAAVL